MAFDGRLVSGIGVLAAVVEAGSFVRAAKALGLTQPGVSRGVARLEARIGVRLLDRTTRVVRLTDEGRRFYEQVGPLLAGIEEAATMAAGSAMAVRGRLRVNIDPFVSRLLLAPRLGAFLDRYPDLELDFVTRGQLGDLVAEGFDVAVRFGDRPPSALIARKLLATRILTVAAPSYLERHGRPFHPRDMAEGRHVAIHFRDPVTGRPFPWVFHRKREVVPVTVPGRLTVTDVETMLGVCLSGQGIAQVMALGTAELLAEKRLIELFPDWPGETFPLYAYHASRVLPSAKVRAFLDFVAEAT
jgi:DNA-binding transcriptional LysR family regulator